MPARRRLLLLTITGLLAACGAPGAPTADGTDLSSSPPPPPAITSTAPTTPDATEAPPTATPSPPASSSTAAPAAASGGCDPATSDLPAEIPNGAERVVEATGDLDGDDVPDRLVTWSLTVSDDEVVHHLRIVTGSGYVAEAELDLAGSMADVRPLGTAAIGDGVTAALVVEDVGASAKLVSLWGLHDFDDDPCALGRLTVADDSAAALFPVGATAGTANGLQCTDVEGVPVVASASATASEDGEQYEVASQSMSWEGAGALRVVSTDQRTIPADEVGQVAGIDCPAISLS